MTTQSYFSITQILHLIVHIIKQNARMQTIFHILIERQLVFLAPLILTKCDLAHLVINGCMHRIPFAKFNCF